MFGREFAKTKTVLTWFLSFHKLAVGFWIDTGGGIFKFDRLASRPVVEIVERLRPFKAFDFVSFAVDVTSSSDEYLVAYSVSRLNLDFSVSMKLRSRLIRVFRVVFVTGIFGAPNCANRYWSSSLLSSFKSSILFGVCQCYKWFCSILFDFFPDTILIFCLKLRRKSHSFLVCCLFVFYSHLVFLADRKNTFIL